MTDRELLEDAAKAGGIKVLRDPHGIWRNCTGLDPAMNIFAAPQWNPLTDDGDALRLAVKLGLTITPNYHVEQRGLEVITFTEFTDSKDFCAATRRAIVRAAAEIGKGMKNSS